MVWDKDKKITTDIFYTTRFPETIILAPDARMARKIVGTFDWEGQEMIRFLEQVLELRSKAS